MIYIGCPPVENEEEALKLMLYHLKMAAMYFEATPEKIVVNDFQDEFSAPAILVWIDAMEKLYPKDES
jgi:hypothetical protein